MALAPWLRQLSRREIGYREHHIYLDHQVTAKTPCFRAPPYSNCGSRHIQLNIIDRIKTYTHSKQHLPITSVAESLPYRKTKKREVAKFIYQPVKATKKISA